MILKTKQQPVELQFDPQWDECPSVTFYKGGKQCLGRLIDKDTIAYVSYPENRWFEFKTELWSFPDESEPKKEKNHSKPEPLKSKQTGTRVIYRTATYPIVCIHRGTGMHKLMIRQGPAWVKFGHDSEPEQIVGLLKNFLEDELDFKFFLLDCEIPDIPSDWMGISVTASKNFKGELQCL
jgi:hypothetical protein